ncbi:MAG: hypothetical protein GY757_53855, partial [bacterium]|nr:hypothetical protein [bacterium]
MDSLKTVLRYQWKSYWRSFLKKRNTRRRFFQLIFLALPFLLGWYYEFLITVSHEAYAGNVRNLERLLIGILLSWTLLPLMANDTYLEISASNMKGFPIDNDTLFRVECFGVLIQPITWLTTLCSLSLVVPLMALETRWLALPTALLFTMIMFLLTILVKNAIYDLPGVRKIFFFLFLMCLFVCTYLGGEPLFEAFSETFGVFLITRLPVNIALNRLPLVWFGVLLLTVLPIFYLTFAVFRRRLSGETMPGRKGNVFIKFSAIPGKLSGLIQKDFYYFLNNSNIYLGACAVLLYLYYLLTETAPEADSLFIVQLFIFLPGMNFAINSLGLENGSGIRRYILLPLKGREILLSRNLGYLFIMLFQEVPVFILVLWKFGGFVFLLGMMEFLVIVLLMVGLGNIVSVRNPVRLEFHRLNLGTLHSAVPFIIAIGLIHIGIFSSVDLYRTIPVEGM